MEQDFTPDSARLSWHHLYRALVYSPELGEAYLDMRSAYEQDQSDFAYEELAQFIRRNGLRDRPNPSPYDGDFWHQAVAAYLRDRVELAPRDSDFRTQRCLGAWHELQLWTKRPRLALEYSKLRRALEADNQNEALMRDIEDFIDYHEAKRAVGVPPSYYVAETRKEIQRWKRVIEQRDFDGEL